MERFKLYELAQLDCEGRNVVRSIGFFTTEDVAEQVKKDVFQIVREKEIIIYDSAEEFTNEQNKKIKIEALKKLTNEEKKILGLT